MAIPDRPNLPYHYHMYDFGGSQAFTPNPNALTPPTSKSGASYNFYSLMQDLQKLEEEAFDSGIHNPAFVQLPPQTANGRNILLFGFGGQAGLNSPTILLTGGIHAREWIAVEIPYLIAEFLIKNYPTGAGVPSPKQQIIKNIVDNRRIFIAPMLNPDGHMYSITTDRLWRKNRRSIQANEFNQPRYTETSNVISYTVSYYPPPTLPPWSKTIQFNKPGSPRKNGGVYSYTGIDLNRNFPTQYWGQIYSSWINADDTSADPDDESYFGPQSSSEFETQAIAQIVQGLAQNHNLAASIDYHSYHGAILYPQERQPSVVSQTIGKSMQALIANQAGDGNYKLGQPNQVLGYYTLGTVKDFIYEKTNSNPTYGIELDPTMSDKSDFPGFELPENQIQSVFEKNIRGALALIACAGQNVQLGGNLLAGYQYPQCAAQFSNWDVFGKGNNLPA